ATGDDAWDRAARRARHGHGRPAVGGRAVAELAVAVRAPAVDLAVRTVGAGVIAPGRDAREHDARRCLHHHGSRAVRRRAVAEPAVEVVAPAMELADRALGAGVIVPGHDALV